MGIIYNIGIRISNIVRYICLSLKSNNMKSIIKLLGLSIGCSCTVLNAQNARPDVKDTDAIILTTVAIDDHELQPLSSLQDIGKLYAL